MNIPIKPYSALFEIVQIAEIKDNVLDVNEMLGFICAISISPKPQDLSDWFPALWKLDYDHSFSSEALAVDFASAVLQFYEHCLLQYQYANPLILPTQSWLNETYEMTEAGSAFASAFLDGFQQTQAHWQNLNLQCGAEPEQQLQTTLLLLSKMATSHHDDPQMQALFLQLPAMQEIARSLPHLLGVLGHFSIQVANDE